VYLNLFDDKTTPIYKYLNKGVSVAAIEIRIARETLWWGRTSGNVVEASDEYKKRVFDALEYHAQMEMDRAMAGPYFVHDQESPCAWYWHEWDEIEGPDAWGHPLVRSGFRDAPSLEESSSSTRVDACRVTTVLPPGVPSTEIMSRFRLTDEWANKLSHIARHPFLKKCGALMKQGCRKSGKRPASPNLWNPVKFAEMLIQRKVKTRPAIERIIPDRFPDWQDAWDNAQAVDSPPDWDDGIEPA